MIDRTHHSREAAHEPTRALHADFTKQTLAMALKAKKRTTTKHNLQGLFSMKSIRFMRTIPGVALSLMVVATGSVGVYALTNWFGGAPTVTEDASIMHLDLSSCKGNMPAGVEPTDDRHDIQFKITGNPHISATDLQHQLLVDCESSAVHEFYNPGQSYDYKSNVTPATITAVSGSTFTVSYVSPASPQTVSKTFTMNAQTPMYDQTKVVQADDFHPGDFIVFATAVPTSEVSEMVNPYASAQVQSIFKTQYDTSKADGSSKGSGLNYTADNIVPLDVYNAPKYK